MNDEKWYAHKGQLTDGWYITTSEVLARGRVVASGLDQADAEEVCRLHNFIIDYGKTMDEILNAYPFNQGMFQLMPHTPMDAALKDRIINPEVALQEIKERYGSPVDKLKNCTCTYTYVRPCDLHPDDTYEQRRERWRKFHSDDEHDGPLDPEPDDPNDRDM